MTTIRDMILRDLRAIGADGVAWDRLIGRDPVVYSATFADLEADTGIYFDARPAFLDDDGSLVPLPEGWMVNDDGCLIYREKGRTVVVLTFCPARRPVWRAAADRCVIGHFHTAPAAWRAAEEWIANQRATVAREE